MQKNTATGYRSCCICLCALERPGSGCEGLFPAQNPNHHPSVQLTDYLMVDWCLVSRLCGTVSAMICTSRSKSISLAIVDTTDEAHELAHCVTVEVRWPERVFCDSPPRREDNKICHSSTCRAHDEYVSYSRLMHLQPRDQNRTWPYAITSSSLLS